MSKRLGGSLFLYNPESQDYCWRESIESLKALCDEIVILDAGSTDGSAELLRMYSDSKTKIICLPNEQWKAVNGREKLSMFTNLCKSSLTTEWHYNQQGDEVLHQDSFKYVRQAIEEERDEGYWISRINMWCDSKHYLDVPDERKPVGDVIVRLAKTQYDSVGDAQSLCPPSMCMDFVDKIRQYHMGFIRSKYVHTKKIKHMLVDVFQMGGNDPKVEAMNGIFDCWGMGFNKEDVKPITEPLPKFVQAWAQQRDKINNFEI